MLTARLSMTAARPLFGLLCLTVLAGWLGNGGTANAQEQPIVIEGQVTNGTPGGGAVEGLTVVLHRESAAGHDHLEATADAGGGFRFDGVAFDPTVAYGVSVSYQGALYGRDIDLSGGSPVPVSLTLYDSSTNNEALSVASASVLFAQADESVGEVVALEIVRIANGSDYTYVPGQGPMNLLRFGLPPGAHGLQVDTQLPGADFVQVDLGFGFLAGIPPGEHEVMFTYRFPYSGAEQVFDKSFLYGAKSLRVLAPEEVLKLSSDQMDGPETIVIGERPYQLLEASGLERGASISVALGRLPQPSMADSWRRRLDRVHFEYAAPIGLGIFMVGLIAFALTRRSGRRGATGDDVT